MFAKTRWDREGNNFYTGHDSPTITNNGETILQDSLEASAPEFTETLEEIYNIFDTTCMVIHITILNRQPHNSVLPADKGLEKYTYLLIQDTLWQ